MISQTRMISATLFVALLMISVSVLAMDPATLYHERTCIACHGAEGKQPVMEEYPKLAGQAEAYLLTQMKDIKNGYRTNAHSVAMQNVMHLVSDEEIAVLAKWLSSLPE
ncbi:MAG: c-type cytochrome [Candidatus Thiodiazotropha taylori]|uniref:C-type cytochrome n=1 Tax=Candidatus Thiodiazotropha taylori TaxID=2792791 RepID=A0A9E4N8A3_9GAMM|nr:c-type cytochrome [Candidatus Thiodiazotropha taylori]MCG7963408.1 c-type cytochrome [Candidatus Thiodiazotropha endolucinida]MCG8017969.1 c-type cytochrome [Candidatus Thiodiazotropha sp. 'RUGA']MCG7894558.1 c-type cytochrome [Candidatus Thiodiazotropha taylori]MCG7906672.1 c-type cytochrome [Candidatus Thiodiazotropha taylori]